MLTYALDRRGGSGPERRCPRSEGWRSIWESAWPLLKTHMPSFCWKGICGRRSAGDIL